MATRMTFALTSDASDTNYPDQDNWPSQANTDSTYQRYNIFGENRTYSYPSSNDDGFNVPTLRFIFLDAYSKKLTNSPKVFLQVPNLFNITSFSDYARTENIFGGGQLGDEGNISLFSGIAKSISDSEKAKDAGATMDQIATATVEALQQSVLRGFASSVGAIGSLGLQTINQYEFSFRQAVNPMAQLLYKGPQYRRYQIPVNIKPKNRQESDNVKKIISIFRVASSPSVPVVTGVLGSESIGAGQSFSFGYPHLTQFTATFINPETDSAKKIFRSFPCVIESVSVDYGSQKMTFFPDGFPTEMTLTLQLTEIMPRTLGDARTDAQAADITIL